MNNFIKYAVIGAFLNIIVLSCNNSYYLKNEFRNVLVNGSDTVTVELINSSSASRILNINFSGSRNSNFVVNFSIKNDSMFFSDKKNDYFFLKLDSGFNAEHLNLSDKFIPFGNIVRNVNYHNESYIIELDRAGNYTTSGDSFIYEITVSKKSKGITELKYFDGNHNIIYR